jgi:hypothetical protein
LSNLKCAMQWATKLTTATFRLETVNKRVSYCQQWLKVIHKQNRIQINNESSNGYFFLIYLHHCTITSSSSSGAREKQVYICKPLKQQGEGEGGGQRLLVGGCVVPGAGHSLQTYGLRADLEIVQFVSGNLPIRSISFCENAVFESIENKHFKP